MEPPSWPYLFQNALVPYPMMLHSEQNCAHFFAEWGIVGWGTGAFWELWNRSIVLSLFPADGIQIIENSQMDIQYKVWDAITYSNLNPNCFIV